MYTERRVRTGWALGRTYMYHAYTPYRRFIYSRRRSYTTNLYTKIDAQLNELFACVLSVSNNSFISTPRN